MKKLKIFALAASLLQAALFSVFAANPPTDFTYDLTDDNKAVKITGLRNDKAEYVIPASIEDFPVVEVDIDEKGKVTPCSITMPEGCVKIKIHIVAWLDSWNGPYKNTGAITVKQLPSTVKDLALTYCKYNGTLPAEIENVYILGDNYSAHVKLNQSLAKLQNLKKIYLRGGVDFTGTANKTPLKLPESLEKLNFIEVNLIDKSICIPASLDSDSYIQYTNVEELIFDEGITNIWSNSFNFNGNLKRIVLPSTLKCVKVLAFTDCPNLSEVVVPDSIGKIETDGNKLESVFDTTSLSLKSRIKLQEAFGFSK